MPGLSMSEVMQETEQPKQRKGPKGKSKDAESAFAALEIASDGEQPDGQQPAVAPEAESVQQNGGTAYAFEGADHHGEVVFD